MLESLQGTLGYRGRGTADGGRRVAGIVARQVLLDSEPHHFEADIPAHVPDSSFWAKVNPVYHPEYFGSPPNRVCFVRFNACDLNSRTYLGSDGRRHSCRRHDRRTGSQLREIVARQRRSNCSVGKLLSIRREDFLRPGIKVRVTQSSRQKVETGRLLLMSVARTNRAIDPAFAFYATVCRFPIGRASPLRR